MWREKCTKGMKSINGCSGIHTPHMMRRFNFNARTSKKKEKNKSFQNRFFGRIKDSGELQLRLKKKNELTNWSRQTTVGTGLQVDRTCTLFNFGFIGPLATRSLAWLPG
jgi:hypothetical protein